jgi:hypothetical protein
LRDLQGAERKPERKISKEEYAMRLAAAGIPLVEVGPEGEAKPDA